jgi:hypothetical protein
MTRESMARRSFVLFLLGVAIAGGGCKSPSQYISPRVEGRVVDSKTRKPIADAEVRRVVNEIKDPDPQRGAEALDATVPAITDEQGNFVVQSRTALAFLRRLHWYTITLSFAHSGYERLKQTYTFSNATNSPAGEPIVRAGDILLTPKPK